MSEKFPSQLPEQEPRYGEILFDRSKYFHGIGFDFLRFKSIMEKGILSEQEAKQENISFRRNYGGYNLGDSVSVAESPAINNSFTFGCFGKYIRGGISFVISNEHSFKAPKGSVRDSQYLDEAFIRGKVKRENITGVMVPEDLLNSPLSELPLGLAKVGYAYIEQRCRQIVGDLESETGYHADTTYLEELIKQIQELDQRDIGYLVKYEERDAIFEKMEHEMGKIIASAFAQKLEKENVTLRDILKVYLPESMKTYNSDGFEVSL